MASKVAAPVAKKTTQWLWPTVACAIGVFGYTNVSNYNKYKGTLQEFQTQMVNLQQIITLQNESINTQHSMISSLSSDRNNINTANVHNNNKLTPTTSTTTLNSYHSIIKSISPAIVNLVIESESNVSFGFFNVQQPIKQLGTGVIIRKDGIIVTNSHVVTTKDPNNGTNSNQDQLITVYLSNSRKVTAHIILKDELNDLALLKIDETNENETFPFIEINNDPSAINVGDRVLAIGNNLGLHNTVTDGIISAIGRAQASQINDMDETHNNKSNHNPQTQDMSKVVISKNPYLPFLQTNAAINQGSSGGALIDLNKKLIGINTAIASPFGVNIGIGFAIPSSYVLSLLRSLQAPYAYNGEIIRPWDGINVSKAVIDTKYLSQNVANELKNNMDNSYGYIDGVQIIGMHKQSPAKLCGIETGDILIQMNKRIAIESADKYWLSLAAFMPKESVNYLVLRWNGDTNEYELLEFDVIIGTPPQASYEDVRVRDSRNVLHGCLFGELQPSLGIELGIDPCREGVMLMEMPFQSFAARTGFKAGDILREIDGVKVENVQQLEGFKISRNKRHNIVIQRDDMIGEINV